MLPHHFHPAVAGWFRRAFAAPTAVQLKAWEAIGSGDHTLISAPTGSGKTLAAFLGVIDQLAQAGGGGGAAGRDASPLCLAVEGAIERHPEEPADASRGDRPRVRGAHARRCADTRCRAHRRHASKRARTNAPHAAAHTRDDARVAIHPAHVGVGSADAEHGAHGDRRRDPRGRAATSAARISRCRSSGSTALCAAPPTRVGISATHEADRRR